MEFLRVDPPWGNGEKGTAFAEILKASSILITGFTARVSTFAQTILPKTFDFGFFDVPFIA